MVCFFSMEGKNKRPIALLYLSVTCEVAQPCLQLFPFPDFQVSAVRLGMTVWASTTPAFLVCLFFLLGWPLGTSSAGQSLVSSASLKEEQRLYLLDPRLVAFGAEP